MYLYKIFENNAKQMDYFFVKDVSFINLIAFLLTAVNINEVDFIGLMPVTKNGLLSTITIHLQLKSFRYHLHDVIIISCIFDHLFWFNLQKRPGYHCFALHTSIFRVA